MNEEPALPADELGAFEQADHNPKDRAALFQDDPFGFPMAYMFIKYHCSVTKVEFRPDTSGREPKQDNYIITMRVGGEMSAVKGSVFMGTGTATIERWQWTPGRAPGIVHNGKQIPGPPHGFSVLSVKQDPTSFGGIWGT